MNESFDAHHQWLGIPPTEQPANYYRLLGLSLFEPNEEVIRIAAEQRQTFLRTFQQGHGAERSQQLLNEISQAKVCLLDPQRRAEYDASLHQPPTLSLSSKVAVPPPGHANSAAIFSENATSPDSGLFDFEDNSKVPSWSRSLSGGLLWGVAASVAMLLITGTLVAIWVVSGGNQPAEIVTGPDVAPPPEIVDTDPERYGNPIENSASASGSGGQESPKKQTATPSGPNGITGDANSQGTESEIPPPDITGNGDAMKPSTGDSTDDSGSTSENSSAPTTEPESDTALATESKVIPVAPAILSDARQTLSASYPWATGDEKGKLLHHYDQMLELAEDESQSDITRLAAILEARSVAWAMVDIPLVTKTTPSLARYGDFDLNAVELTGLLNGLAQAETGEDFSKLWWLSLSLTPNLVAERRFAELEQLWTAFEESARSDAGRPFRKGIIDHQRLVDDWQTRFRELPRAVFTEKAFTDSASTETVLSSLSPEEHQKIGLWLLEIERKPQEALQHFSLGPEPELQKLAQNELAQSSATAESTLVMAEDWLAYASSLPVPEDSPGSGRYAFQAHALQGLQTLHPVDLSESQRDRFKAAIESLVNDPNYDEIKACATPLAGLFCNDLVVGAPVSLPEVSGEVSALSVTSDGLKVAIGSDAGTSKGQLAVVDLLSKKTVIEPQEMGAAIFSIDWYPDDQRLICVGSGNLLKNWDTRRPISKSTDACPTIPGGINLVAVGPKGRTVVGASNNGTLYFWQGNNGKLLTTIRNHRQEITSLAVSEDGSMMVTGSRDQKAQLWNEQGPLALLNGHSDRVHLADISGDGLFAAIADPSNLVTIWNTADYQQMTELSVDSGGKLVGIHLLRQAPWLLTVTEEGEVGIYDLAYGTWINRITLNLDGLSQTDLSSDGSSLVLGTNRGQVYRLSLDAGLLPMTRPTSLK